MGSRTPDWKEELGRFLSHFWIGWGSRIGRLIVTAMIG